MRVEIQAISKRFGAMQALAEVSISVPEKSFVTFLGPSGCGKTTLLRILAGLIEPDSGRIVVADKVLSSAKSVVPPERRGMGMVFQSFAVWPHMSVFENVAYGLRIRQLSREQIAGRVRNALALVQLSGLEGRYPRELSGGQQQRVALARSIVIEPSILLLDEPLSNLDAKLRHDMRVELREIQRRVGISFVYVTHDQDEALAISDKIVVLNQGKIEQAGSPQEIYENPSSAFVAGFLGNSSILAGRLSGTFDGYGVVDITDDLRFRCRLPAGGAVGQPIQVCVRQGGVEIGAQIAGHDHQFEAEVRDIQYLGENEEVLLSVAGVNLKAKRRAHRKQQDRKVWVSLDPENCLGFPQMQSSS